MQDDAPGASREEIYIISKIINKEQWRQKRFHNAHNNDKFNIFSFLLFFCHWINKHLKYITFLYYDL